MRVANSTIEHMDAEAAERRIRLSRRVVARLERNSITCHPRAALRMIRAEVVVLEDLIYSNPGNALKAASLIKRYDAIIAKLREKLGKRLEPLI